MNAGARRRRKVSSGRGGNSLLLPLPLSVHNFKVFALLSCTLIRQPRGKGKEKGRGESGEKLSLWLSAFCILTGWQFNIYIYIVYIFAIYSAGCS